MGRLRRAVLMCAAAAVPVLAAARDFAPQFPHEVKSRYFDVRYQTQAWNAQGFAAFADAFVELVNRDFVKVSFQYPILVLVLPDRAAFQAYVKKEFGEKDPPTYGIYLPQHKLFATFEASGWGTFTHEIMHPLVEYNLPARPPWAVEAIPSFFEKFFGYVDGGQLVLTWGYQNPWRIDALGPRLSKLDLERLVAGNPPRNGYDTSELRMVSMFLWHEGRFKKLLQLIADKKHSGYATYFEAAMGASLKEVLPRWRAYLDEVNARRGEAERVPASQIFATRQAYEEFMAAAHLVAPGGG